MSNNSMGNDKSILQKIADTVKDIAAIATDAANDALKAEAPAPKKHVAAVVTDVPLAALGLVSDPMMVPPMALVPARKKRRAATKPAAKKTARKTAKKTTRKTARKVVEKAAKKTAKKTAKKIRKSAARKTAKKARKSTRR